MPSTVSVATMAERPPYVTFEFLAVEDRAASLQAKRYQAVNIPHAVITPQGSKDRIYREVDSWFEYLEQQVQEERFPALWLDHYRKLYEAWKNGQEMPANGTPIKTWGAISPAQVKMLLAANVQTVEDLAQANEQALHRIGMGARTLKDAAIRWIAEQGQHIEELDELKAENKDLVKRLQAMEEAMAKLSGVQIPEGAVPTSGAQLAIDAALAAGAVAVERKAPKIGSR